MKFKIRDVPDSPVTRLLSEMLICSGITYDVIDNTSNEILSKGSLLAFAGFCIILLVWIIWFSRMFLGDKSVSVMLRNPHRVTTIVNGILLVIWFITSFTRLCHPVWMICGWVLFAISLIYYLAYSHKHGYSELPDNV